MRHTALAIVLVLSAFATPARAADDTGKLSLGAINKALDAVRKDQAPCKTAVLQGLKDGRDIIESAKGRPNVDTFTRARRKVEDAVDASGDVCAATTLEAMQGALRVLGENVDAAATKAAEPSPGEKRNVEMRQCWNYKNDWSAVDPGCYVNRGGSYAIGRADFDKLLAKVRGADDRYARTGVMERELGRSSKIFVTCAQLAVLLRVLENDIDRAETVKNTAARLVDFGNSGTIAATMSDMASRKDALEAIGEAANRAK
jgi:hypothetical protein